LVVIPIEADIELMPARPIVMRFPKGGDLVAGLAEKSGEGDFVIGKRCRRQLGVAAEVGPPLIAPLPLLPPRRPMAWLPTSTIWLRSVTALFVPGS
jgi:hypothetical protein